MRHVRGWLPAILAVALAAPAGGVGWPCGGGSSCSFVQVATSGGHVVALTTSGEVVTWGRYESFDRLAPRGIRLRPTTILTADGSAPLSGVRQVGLNWALTTSGELLGWSARELRATPVLDASGTPLTGLVQVSGQGGTFLALTTAGEVLSWGGNYGGQLGDGTTTSRRFPDWVLGPGGVGRLSGIVAVDAGDLSSLAVTAGGEVITWGWNHYGQLGWGVRNQLPNLPDYALTTLGTRLTGIVSASIGGDHVVALDASGRAWTWGRYYFDALGRPEWPNERAAPAEIAPGVPVIGLVAATAGDGHVVALTSAGEVLAWGRADSGASGASSDVEHATPVLDGDGLPLTAMGSVTAGGEVSLAIGLDGRLHAWGDDENGALGRGGADLMALPTCSAGDPDFVQLSASRYHVLGLTASGEVWAWGSNGAGELGDGTQLPRARPVRVLGIDGVGTLDAIAQVSAGEWFSLALTTSGEVLAWGHNRDGSCGDGTTAFLRPWPVRVRVPGGASLGDAVHVAAGRAHGLAVLASGEVRGWGYNAGGHVGDGTFVNRRVATPVVGLGGGASRLSGILRVAAGSEHSVALGRDGSVVSWGRGQYGPPPPMTTPGWAQAVPFPVPGVGGAGTLGGIVDIAAGGDVTLARTPSGELAWFASRGAPQWVLGLDDATPLSDVAAMDVGDGHALATLDDGSLVAWGRGAEGQLGSGFGVSSTTRRVRGPDGAGFMTDVVAIAAGEQVSLARSLSTGLHGWGDGAYGSRGDGHLSANPRAFEATCGPPLPNAGPSCGAGPDVLSSCGGPLRLAGFADDPDGDGLLVSWASDCGGTIADRGFLSPLLTPGPGCGRTCAVTMTVSDWHGQSCSDALTVTIDDLDPPAISVLPSPSTVDCPESPSFATATASDACSALVTPTATDDVLPGPCPGTAIHRRTWTAVDDCGNVATATQEIAVIDATPPSLVAPEDETIACAEVPVFGTPVVSDACGTVPSLTSVDATTPGPCTGSSVVTRTWTAVDACGNAATASQRIVLRDGTPPILTLPMPSEIPCPESPVFAVPLVTDDCGLVALTFADERVNGPCAGTGTFTRTWRGVDSCGNEAQASQVIVSSDATPAWLDCRSRIEVPATSPSGAFVPVVANVADACDAAPLVVNDRGAGGLDASGDYPCGETTVAFSVTDCSGNASRCDTVVSVRPPGDPVGIGSALRLSREPGEDPHAVVRLSWTSAPLPPHLGAEIRRTATAQSRPYPVVATGVGTTLLDRDASGPLLFWQVHARDCLGRVAPDPMLPSP